MNDITDRRFLNVITFILHINIELVQLFLHELKRTSILLPWSCFRFFSVTRSLGLAHDGGQISMTVTTLFGSEGFRYSFSWFTDFCHNHFLEYVIEILCRCIFSFFLLLYNTRPCAPVVFSYRISLNTIEMLFVDIKR